MTTGWLVLGAIAALTSAAAQAQQAEWPPQIPGGKTRITIETPDLLKPTETLRSGVKVAKAVPTVEFMYYDCQTYPGRTWSNWGDGSAAGTKYYSAIGDHDSPGGNAFVYEYDAKTKTLKKLLDVRSVLKRPDGWYTPGKIHSRIELGSDGWLYFSTHRGSTRVALDPKNHYDGDWILRHNPETGKTEVVAHAPLPMQCLPASVLDPDRLIFYAGTADGLNKKEPQFLAYDIKNRKVLYSDPYGFYRYAIFARSTGKLYFHGNTARPSRSRGQLVRFDPARPAPDGTKPAKPVPIDANVGLRAATQESADHKVYTVDRDELWVFDTQTEKAHSLGPAAVGVNDYTTSIDLDPKTGRYLYYVPGAHGGSERDGTPLVQYDLKTKTRKVICFLHPVLLKKVGYVPIGTFSTAVSPDGGIVYVTWNGDHTVPRDKPQMRGKFRSCAMTAIHVPASERKP